MFNNIITYNKFFDIGFVFFCHKNKYFYHYILTKIHELCTCIEQKERFKIILKDKKNAFIISLEEILFFNYYMLYI